MDLLRFEHCCSFILIHLRCFFEKNRVSILVQAKRLIKIRKRENVSSGSEVHAPDTSDEIRVKQYCENYLSSNVVSIVLVYFLNPLHSGPKYLIQFFLIDTRQTTLQEIKGLIVINHLNAFKFLFHGRKQVEVVAS
jgi:hypothetical protein